MTKTMSVSYQPLVNINNNNHYQPIQLLKMLLTTLFSSLFLSTSVAKASASPSSPIAPPLLHNDEVACDGTLGWLACDGGLTLAQSNAVQQARFPPAVKHSVSSGCEGSFERLCLEVRYASDCLCLTVS